MWNLLTQQITRIHKWIITTFSSLWESLVSTFYPFMAPTLPYLFIVSGALRAFFMRAFAFSLSLWNSFLVLISPIADFIFTTLPHRIVSAYSNGEMPGLVLSNLPDWAIVRHLVQTFQDYDADFRWLYSKNQNWLRRVFAFLDLKSLMVAVLGVFLANSVVDGWTNAGFLGAFAEALAFPFHLGSYAFIGFSEVVWAILDLPYTTFEVTYWVIETYFLCFHDTYLTILYDTRFIRMRILRKWNFFVAPILYPLTLALIEALDSVFSPIFSVLASPINAVLSNFTYQLIRDLGFTHLIFFYLSVVDTFVTTLLSKALSLVWPLERLWNLFNLLVSYWIDLNLAWLEVLRSVFNFFTIDLDIYVYLYLFFLTLFFVVSLLSSINLISTSTYQAYLAVKAILFLIFVVFSGLYFNLPADESYLWSPAVVLNTTTFKTPILAFGISKISYFFSSLVLFIFFGVLSFAYPYMLKEQKKFKFITLLLFFAASMLLFFHAKTLAALILAWKLIGVTSFFLIGHYNTKVSVFKSAFKAMLFNIFSDLVFVLFVALYFKVHGTYEVKALDVLKAEAVLFNFFYFEVSSAALLGLLLFIFAAVKSAQGLNYVWLLDSMEAPVPASALIHSATLVVTGVYLFAVLGVFFVLDSTIQTLVVSILLITAFTASFCACYQKDLKKALAFSTISNTSLAFLGTITGLEDGYATLAISHGLIKSLCFLICGYLFFFNNHNQDAFFFAKPRTRTISYLFLFLFFIFSAAPISPFYSSKHEVAAIATALGTSDLYLVGCFMTGLSCLSSAYGAILIGRLMLQEPRGYSSPSTQDPREELSSKTRFLLLALVSFTTLVVVIYWAIILLSGSFHLDDSINSALIDFIEEAIFEDGGSFFFLVVVTYLLYRAMWPKN